MSLGAIVKAGAKSLAKEKAKSFITGKGKGKGGALVKAGGQKPTVNPSNLMGRQVGGETGTRGADIPASKQTINVTPLGSDSPVKSGGGSGDIKIVQDISIAVSAIAESMQNSLTLKEKAQRKARKAAEKDKRAAQEADIEKPDKPKKPDDGMPKFKVPGAGLLSGIFGFITKFIYGIVIMKLIEFLPKLKGLLGFFKKAQIVFDYLASGVGFILNALVTAVDFGYKLVDGAEKIVGKIFGEEGAEKFRTFIKNFTTLINSFLIFKILKAKVFDAIIRNIKNAFKFAKNLLKNAAKLAKNIIKNAGKLVTKLFPQLANFGSKLFQTGKGLVTKGLAKVGGFAAKIFGKAASFIAPGFKAAKPFASKFFSKIPIVGPLVITIVSLLSGEPATQAIFKGLGAALGGALGTLIPIPFIGTLIGETIGVFVGDLLYEGLMGKGWEAAGQKLKDTLMTLLKGGKIVTDWIGGGIKAFINNVLKTDPVEVKEKRPPGIRDILTRGARNFGLYNFFEGLGFTGGKDGQIDKFPNLLNVLNPLKFYPLLFKSFFGKREESEVSAGGGNAAVVSENQDNKNSANAEAVASETTYESGEGDALIIPVPIQQTQQVAIKNKRGRTIGYKTVVIDDTELAMYGGK